jgi:hypothetical protein
MTSRFVEIEGSTMTMLPIARAKQAAIDLYDPWLRLKVRKYWHHRRRASVAHRLPKPLIVSLTSYPPRFHTLGLTLRCLLAQSIRADQTILWIADQDRQAVTEDIAALAEQGIIIRYCDDVRSHKKYTYAFREFADCFVVTADDDAYYWPEWLEELVGGYRSDAREFACLRAHKINFAGSGTPESYDRWEHNTDDSRASPGIFPTGLGGVLYQPAAMHPDVTNLDRAMALTPTADDLWLYWMARRAGFCFRKIGPRRRFHNWTGTQTQSLYQVNAVCANGNDVQVKAMIDAYGWP